MENRIVIHEETEAITRQKQNVEANIALLNDIHRIKPFNDFQTVLAWSKDSGFIQRLFFAENQEAEKLSKISKMDFVYPPHLVSLQRLLQSVNIQTGAYAKYDAKQKSWVVNVEALEVFNDRFRRFAETDEQISRWKFINQYCDTLNQLSPGNSARKNFAGHLAVIKSSADGYKLFPNWQFVFADYRY